MKSPSEFKGTGTILCLFDRKKRNRFVVIEINAIFAIGSGRNPDYIKAFAIISRSAKSLGNLLEITTHRDNM